ncbi:MAG: membrane protein insertion efficiency factor YidD [Desulfobacteraceae bacterium]|nr:membrane protein insertion efficiency factor YidD [Desulfobacteraceae bacterium]
MRDIIFLTLIFSILISGACSHTPPRELAGMESGEPYASMAFFYGEYLNHLSAVRRGHCPMYPSCSEYSRQAVETHGFSVGWIMAMDRLMRCGRDEVKSVPRVYIEGSWRYYDPLENNDFWHAHP